MLTAGFAFDHNYENREQVAEWLPAFSELRAAMTARGEYPYNDAFRGLIPGIAGPDEDTAIYLLQGLCHRAEQGRELERMRAEGFRELENLDETTRFERVALWREDHYVGGTGRLDVLERARVVPREGRPYAVLPRGKRTNGYLVGSASVLVLEGSP